MNGYWQMEYNKQLYNMQHSYLKKAATFSGVTTRGPVPCTLRAYSMCTAMCVTHPNSTCSLPILAVPPPTPQMGFSLHVYQTPWTVYICASFIVYIYIM